MRVSNVNIFAGPGLRLEIKRAESGTMWINILDAETTNLSTPASIFVDDKDKAAVDAAVRAFNVVMESAAAVAGPSNV